MKQKILRIHHTGRQITVVRKPLVNNQVSPVKNYYCVSQSSLDRFAGLVVDAVYNKNSAYEYNIGKDTLYPCETIRIK